jgi:hypothetical protein
MFLVTVWWTHAPAFIPVARFVFASFAPACAPLLVAPEPYSLVLKPFPAAVTQVPFTPLPPPPD